MVPVTIEQIEQLRADGTLSDDDLIRREDQDTWSPLSELQALATSPAGIGESLDEPAEIGDLSELSFTFEENSPSRRKAPQRAAQVVVSAPAPAPPQVPPQAPPVVVETQYYYQSLGQILGPMPLRELIQLGEAGRCFIHGPGPQGRNGCVAHSGRYPELAAALSVPNARNQPALLFLQRLRSDWVLPRWRTCSQHRKKSYCWKMFLFRSSLAM